MKFTTHSPRYFSQKNKGNRKSWAFGTLRTSGTQEVLRGGNSADTPGSSWSWERWGRVFRPAVERMDMLQRHERMDNGNILITCHSKRNHGRFYVSTGPYFFHCSIYNCNVMHIFLLDGLTTKCDGEIYGTASVQKQLSLGSTNSL